MGGTGISLPYIYSIVVPRTNLTAKTFKNPGTWMEDCEKSFTQLKYHLGTAPVLQSLDFMKQFLVQVDASANGFRAVLAHGCESSTSATSSCLERPDTQQLRKSD